MHIASNDQNALPFADKLFRLLGGRCPRIGQLILNLLVVRQMSKIFGGGDRYRDERPALSSLSYLLISNPIGLRAELLEIGGQFLPVRKLAIRARPKTECLFGRGSSLFCFEWN